MVPREEQIHYNIPSLEADSTVFLLPGRYFRPLFFVAEKFIHLACPQRGLTSDLEDVPTSR